MTTLTDLAHLSDADVRPDVRTEAHTPRRRKQLKNPAWLVFLLLWLAVFLGGLFVVAWTLGATAAPPTA